jgi:hypothetical protein
MLTSSQTFKFWPGRLKNIPWDLTTPIKRERFPVLWKKVLAGFRYGKISQVVASAFVTRRDDAVVAKLPLFVARP